MTNRAILLPIVFASELVLAILVFQVLTPFECRLTEIEAACRGLRSFAVRGFCLFAAVGLFLWVKPALRAVLWDGARQRPPRAGLWALLHLAGLLLAVLPWVLAAPDRLHGNFPVYLLTLAAGGSLAAIGGLFWMMPATAWADFLRAGRGGMLVVAVVALAIPDLAEALGLAWAFDAVLTGTFYGTGILLSLLGQQVLIGFTPPSIGTQDFVVEIAASCSGVEGIALITGFLVIYAVLMRDTIRPARFWLVLWPLALLTSWLFNIVRITVLILIGAHVSPDLAVNGFHSFAGWLFFAALSLGILAVVQTWSWLHHPPEAEGRASETGIFRNDWAAARIVPFIVFMVSGLAAQAFWVHPELAYPAQVLVMAAALWLFRGGLLPLTPGIDPVAVLGGIGVAALWLAVAPPASGPLPGLATLGPVALAGWVVARVVGTTLLVPIVEEAFFRGYLLTRLDSGGPMGRAAAVAVSTFAFAALHGRVASSAIAGLVFALVMLRRGSLKDAILCHAIANGLIAAAALWSGDWSLI